MLSMKVNIMYRTWENFGGGNFWRINGSKVFGKENFGESVGSLLKTLAFINIGGENFGELPILRQIRQNFPPPKFSHVRYYPLLSFPGMALHYWVRVGYNTYH